MDKSLTMFKQFVSPFGFNDTDFLTLIEFCDIVQFSKGAEIMKAEVMRLLKNQSKY